MNPLLRKLLARVEDPDKVWRRLEKAAHGGSAECPSCHESIAQARGEGWLRRYTCSICDTPFSLLWPTPMSETRVGVFATVPEWLDSISRSICFGPRKAARLRPGCNKPRADTIRAVADDMVANHSRLVRMLFALRRLPEIQSPAPQVMDFEGAGIFVLPQPDSL